MDKAVLSVSQAVFKGLQWWDIYGVLDEGVQGDSMKGNVHIGHSGNRRWGQIQIQIYNAGGFGGGGGGGLLSRKIGGGVPPAAENWTLNGWAENGI